MAGARRSFCAWRIIRKLASCRSVAQRSGPSSCGSKRRLGVRLDALDHGAETVGALRGQVLAQSDAVEYVDGIGGEDLARRLTGIDGEQNRDETAHDMSVAVACEREYGAILTIRLRRRREPDLAGAALHFVGFLAVALVELREAAPEFDHIAVAIVPLVQQGEILDDLVDVHGLSHGGAR